MYPKFLFFLVPAVLLLAAALLLFLWDRAQKESISREASGGNPEGAFRSFYHALWVLLLWSGLALSFPFWISYKQRLSGLDSLERWLSAGKVLVFPAIMLLLLWYGGRQGYLKWIDSLNWPDKENQ